MPFDTFYGFNSKSLHDFQAMQNTRDEAYFSFLNYKFIVDFIHCYITVNQQQGIHEQTSPCLSTGIAKNHYSHVMANRISLTVWIGQCRTE